MKFGTMMGLFWIFKFVFLPLCLNIPFFFILFIVLSMAVPFLGYYYARMFRDRVIGGYISFSQAWVFTTFMYVFAALLVAVAHFIYFQFLDNGIMLESFMKYIEELKKLESPELEPAIKFFEMSYASMSRSRPIDLTLQKIYSNIVTGGFLGIPTAWLVMRKKSPTSSAS